jgi:hypothetical protein
VFTLCDDEDERRDFITALLDATDRGSQVVIALRADFYGHCAVYPRLAAALVDQQAPVGPMSEEELRRAIERPAERAGLLLEPGLVEGILRDVVGEPGALPLLSHSLLETWKRRSARMLTLIGYLRAGGVQGAIAKTAETVYHEALTPEQQALARNIFLRSTELGEGTEDTRRRVSLAELTPRVEQRDDVDEVLRTLADARLVTIGEGTVEVAHEALIRHWPTLRMLAIGDAPGVVTTFYTSSRQKLGEYRIGETIGEGLLQTLAFSPDGSMIAVIGRATFTNPALVVDLLDARTLEQSHRVEVPPLQDPVDFFIGTPVFAADGRDVLVLQGNPDGLARSELWRVHVDTGEIEGRPVRVGGSALDIFPSRSGRRVFATSPDDDVTQAIDTESLRVVRRHPVGGMAGALSPDGRALAVGSRDGSIRLLNMRSGAVRRFARAHRVDVLDMAFTPYGRTLVSSDADGGVIAWDVARGEVSEELSLHLGPVRAVVISPDARSTAQATTVA